MASGGTIVVGEGTSFRLVTGAFLLELVRSASLLRWEYNREVDEERVARMYEAQQERLRNAQAANLFLPVPITVCRSGGALLLMDGQHRLAVLSQLSRAGLVDPALVSLMLCEVACATPEEVDDVFVRINSGTPVPASYYNARVNTVLGEFTRRLAGQFPKAVSTAARPVRPNFNKDRVRDEMALQLPLRDAVIDKKITAADLLRVAMDENDVEASISAATRRKVPASVQRRAEHTGFYLGLREGWAVAVAMGALRPD